MARGFAAALLLLLQLVAVSPATEGRRHDDDDGVSPSRNDRKLIFVNNEAFDLTEEERARLWDSHVGRSGRVPDAQGSDDGSREDPSLEEEEEGGRGGGATMAKNSAESYRFVADPDKAHLIEPVGEEEAEKLREPTTTTPAPEVGERVDAGGSEGTATVHYEATRVSVLSFLWTELKNLGELLGREVLDTVSARLRRLWQALVEMVRARRRRAVPDQSTEL